MAIAKLDFKLRNYEIAAYELSKSFINKGYKTDVIEINGLYSTIIYKEHYLNIIIGTPAVIKATFKDIDGGTLLEVETTTLKMNAERVVKETLLVVTVIPGVSKLIELSVLKEKVKKEAIKVAYKCKLETKKGDKK